MTSMVLQANSVEAPNFYRLLARYALCLAALGLTWLVISSLAPRTVGDLRRVLAEAPEVL